MYLWPSWWICYRTEVHRRWLVNLDSSSRYKTPLTKRCRCSQATDTPVSEGSGTHCFLVRYAFPWLMVYPLRLVRESVQDADRCWRLARGRSVGRSGRSRRRRALFEVPFGQSPGRNELRSRAMTDAAAIPLAGAQQWSASTFSVWSSRSAGAGAASSPLQPAIPYNFFVNRSA